MGTSTEWGNFWHEKIGEDIVIDGTCSCIMKSSAMNVHQSFLAKKNGEKIDFERGVDEFFYASHVMQLWRNFN
jgi:hypothetical protein